MATDLNWIMNRRPPEPKPKIDQNYFLRRAERGVQEAMQSRDMLLGHVARSIEEMNKIINLLHERLATIYALYFPELETKESKKYAQLVMVIDRKAMDTKELAKLIGHEKAMDIAKKAEASLGMDFTPEDVAHAQALAQQVLFLHGLLEKYEQYQDTLAEELCPNIRYLAGADIAAKLVARVGSIQRLAMLPASTIQVLGAEKALFKHLRNRKIDPPKHGILFQHVRISSSPKKVRGRIARALANKIALAAKADAFSKRFIAEDIKKSFDQRCEEVMKQYEQERARAKGPSEPGASSVPVKKA